MSSFFSDDRGMIEPYSELPAMALAVVGFIIFMAVLAQTYMTYQEKSFIAGHYQDASNLANKLGQDSSLIGTRPGIIDTEKLENLKKDPNEILEKYGSYYNLMFKVESNSMERSYNIIIKKPGSSDPKAGVSASIPVTIRLNDVEELPGTLTVRIWSKK
ncbi:MAG: hypothetical protein OIN87_06385 [Candidatus Methanoperedens sp.]|nr:hypothetical protein [Candidatus Methanoperedens sp.]